MKKILFFSHESKMYGAPWSMLILADGIRDQYDVEMITIGQGDLFSAAQDKGLN